MHTDAYGYRVLFTCVEEGVLLVTRDQDIPLVLLESRQVLISRLQDSLPPNVRAQNARMSLQAVFDAQGAQVITIDVPGSMMAAATDTLYALGCDAEWVHVLDLYAPSPLLEEVLDYSVAPRENAPAFRSRAEACAALGISEVDARDPKTLKSVYRKRALETHPDRGGSDAEFKQVNAAFHYLESGAGGTATSAGGYRPPPQPSASSSSWDDKWGPERGSPRKALTDPWTRLPSGLVQTYHAQLEAIVRSLGLDAFRVRRPRRTGSKTLRVCCGGSPKARIRGFAEMFGTAETTVERDGVAANNNLIGCMNAHEIQLMFLDRADFWGWWADGVEAQFLHLLKPINKGITYVIRFLNTRPPEEQEIEIFLAVRSMLGNTGGSVLFQPNPRVAPSNRSGDHGSFAEPEFDGMVLVPSGEFGGIEIAAPVLVSQAEVTQGFYESVTGDNPCKFTGDDLPFDMFTWVDAVRFVNELSGADACYTVYEEEAHEDVDWRQGCTGFRLPTEREWEYAARAFSPFEFSGSDHLNDVGWHAGNSGSWTHPVGQLKPNAFGTYDMSGNVWEWCWDLDSGGGGSDRALRGGSWVSGVTDNRVASRAYFAPTYRSAGRIGCRLCRSLPKQLRALV